MPALKVGNKLFIVGELNDDTCASAIAHLYDPEVKIVVVDSTGGDVHHALALHDLMRGRDDLSVVASGMCASSANLILLAVPPERRFATWHTVFWIHEAMGGAEGTVSSIADQLSMLKETEMLYLDILVSAWGFNEASRKYRDGMSFSAVYAKYTGYISAIVRIEGDSIVVVSKED